jgi:parallel beta-helix repeat protein
VAARNDAEGIDLDSVQMVTIDTVKISNNGDKGISVNKPKDAPENKEVHVMGNSIEGNGTGIKLQHTDSAFITNNCFSGNKDEDPGKAGYIDIEKNIIYNDLEPDQINTIRVNTHSNTYQAPGVSCHD